MKATLNKHLHERALGNIDMIETADQRIKIQEGYIANPPIFSIRETAETRKASLVAAKQRLEKAYNTTIDRIQKHKP